MDIVKTPELNHYEGCPHTFGHIDVHDKHSIAIYQIIMWPLVYYFKLMYPAKSQLKIKQSICYRK